jgi:hypothetical protein
MIQSMVSLSKHEGDEGLLARVQALIAKEQEVKYRRQYEALVRAK